MTLRVFNLVQGVRFFQTLFVILQTQRQKVNCRFEGFQSRTRSTRRSNTLCHSVNTMDRFYPTLLVAVHFGITTPTNTFHATGLDPAQGSY